MSVSTCKSTSVSNCNYILLFFSLNVCMFLCLSLFVCLESTCHCRNICLVSLKLLTLILQNIHYFHRIITYFISYFICSSVHPSPTDPFYGCALKVNIHRFDICVLQTVTFCFCLFLVILSDHHWC